VKETISNTYLQWLREQFEDSPFWQHMGMSIEKLEPGDVIVKMPVKGELVNSNGMLHGGALTSILDTIGAVVIRSEREVRVATVSLTTQFIAPVTEGALHASAKIVNPGRRTVFVEAKVVNDSGDIISTAIGTYAIIGNLESK
jgi:uncharacterized protein (TIGR00369 family)